jgi:NAD+ kinase
MDLSSSDIQFMIREHMIENSNETIGHDVDNGFINKGEEMHLRWNSQKGRIYIDGSHLTHNLELGDEIMIDNQAPPLPMFIKKSQGA